MTAVLEAGPLVVSNARYFQEELFDTSLLERAPRAVAATGRVAMSETTDVFADEQDHINVVEQGFPKHGRYVPPEQLALLGLANPARQAGMVVHKMMSLIGKGELDVLEAIEGYSEKVLKVNGVTGDKEKYSKYPPIYRKWSERIAKALPMAARLLRPPKGWGSLTVHEAHIYNDDESAKVSAARINDLVADEREERQGSPGPIERALRASPILKLYGSAKGGFQEALNELPRDQRRELKRLIHRARTHHLTKHGDMMVCPTSRPDIIDLQYRLNNLEARNVAGALRAVLDAGIGFDLEALSKQQVAYEHFGKGGKVTRELIDVSTALYWAADGICRNLINCRVIDIKTQTHDSNTDAPGNKWEKLDELWYDKFHAGNLNKIFSDRNLSSFEPEFSELQKHWRPYERDVAASSYSLICLLERGVREYRVKNRGATGARISWNGLKRGISGAVLVVDFNISKAGEGLEPHERGVGDTALSYVHNQPIATTGVPSKVSMVLKDISPWRLRNDIENRGYEMRGTYYRSKMGEAAVKAQRRRKLGKLSLAA